MDDKNLRFLFKQIPLIWREQKGWGVGVKENERKPQSPKVEKRSSSLKCRKEGNKRARKTQSEKQEGAAGSRPASVAGRGPRWLRAASSIAYKLLLEAPGTPIRSVHLRDRRLISVDGVEGRH